jgi:hypothetical protein
MNGGPKAAVPDVPPGIGNKRFVCVRDIFPPRSHARPRDGSIRVKVGRKIRAILINAVISKN